MMKSIVHLKFSVKLNASVVLITCSLKQENGKICFQKFSGVANAGVCMCGEGPECLRPPPPLFRKTGSYNVYLHDTRIS